MSEKKIDFSEYVDDRKYTKGMCYALCEFLESLVRYNQDDIADIAETIGYEKDTMIELLDKLSSDINAVICDEQDERDDTDQMAQIMEIVHIPGHDD